MIYQNEFKHASSMCLFLMNNKYWTWQNKNGAAVRPKSPHVRMPFSVLVDQYITCDKLNNVLNSTVFCDRTPYSLVKVYQRFRGTYCLHLEGLRVSQATSKMQAASRASRCLRLAGCLPGLFWNSEHGDSIFLQNIYEYLPDYTLSQLGR
jgi:hypothetical protein